MKKLTNYIALLIIISSTKSFGQFVKVTMKDTTKIETVRVVAFSKNIIALQGGRQVKLSEMARAHIYNLTNDDKALLETLTNAGVLVTFNESPNGTGTKYGSWVIEEMDAVFDKVYEVPGSADELRANVLATLRAKSFIVDLVDGETITGRIEKWRMDYKKYGGTAFSVATGFTSGTWYGAFMIQFKDGKYRVKVRDLSVEGKSTGVIFSGVLVQGDARTAWAEWVLKKDRSGFKEGQRDDAVFMSNFLTKEFQADTTKKSDDW